MRISLTTPNDFQAGPWKLSYVEQSTPQLPLSSLRTTTKRRHSFSSMHKIIHGICNTLVGKDWGADAPTNLSRRQAKLKGTRSTFDTFSLQIQLARQLAHHFNCQFIAFPCAIGGLQFHMPKLFHFEYYDPMRRFSIEGPRIVMGFVRSGIPFQRCVKQIITNSIT
jgi:hypothetical protein